MPTFERVQDLFRLITSEVDFVTNVPEEGCYARAHLMAIELYKRGFETVKVFAKGPLRFETEHVPKGFVNWSHHISAGVIVETPAGKQLLILDPSTGSNPITLNDWISRITKNLGGGEPSIEVVNQFKYKINDGKKFYWDWNDCKRMSMDLKSIKCFSKIREKYKKGGQNITLEEAEMDGLLGENGNCN